MLQDFRHPSKSLKPHNTFIAVWLWMCAGMVLAMAVIGAITRLTESGLSMVEWRPYIGALPPFSDAEWQRVFHLYQQTPEFRLKNSLMDLAGFKEIFFWEWLHRFWGQLIGIVYAVPCVWLWICGRVPSRLKPHLVMLFVLGAAQGIMGWYMVKSGLIDRPDVSHYRLAVHLLLAFSLFAGLVWTALETRRISAPLLGSLPQWHIVFVTVFFLLTVTWGAFTAGLDAGFAHNTFPWMDGRFFPPEAQSWAITENRALIQFTHRWMAVVTALLILSLAWRLRSVSLAVAVLAQVGLGIATLVWVVPIPLAAAHQAGAFIVAGVLVWVVHGIWCERGESNP